MASLKRESVEVGFQHGNSRLRVSAGVGLALGLVPGKDVEMIGFLRAAEELVCTYAAKHDAGPLASVLAIDASHDDPDVLQPSLDSLPATKVLVAPDRIVRFQMKWISDKQIDLQFTKEIAEMLGRSDLKTKVRIITWKGWLIVMSRERYDEHRVQLW